MVREWSRFGVADGQAWEGGATKLITAIWNAHRTAQADGSHLVYPGIERDDSRWTLYAAGVRPD